jgi:hypothetical protein
MKKLSIIVIALIGLLVAFMCGFVLANQQNRKLLTVRWFVNLERSRQLANDAYYNEDPRVAIWAIKQSVQVFTEGGHGDTHKLFGTNIPLFLSISYTRLAKLYRQIGDQSSFRQNIDKAMTYAKERNPGLSELELLESQAKFDELEKESFKKTISQPTPARDVATRAAHEE